MDTHKTKASKEVLNRVLVKDVVLDAVVALMQQLPVLGDEVADGPGGKLLVELVFHIVDQHFNVGVDLHLLLHPAGHLDPFLDVVVTWYVDHLDQRQRFPQISKGVRTFPCGWSRLLGLGHSSLACASLLDWSGLQGQNVLPDLTFEKKNIKSSNIFPLNLLFLNSWTYEFKLCASLNNQQIDWYQSQHF